MPDDEATGRQLVDPRAVRRHNDPMDLVELARAVQQADNFVSATTSGKLQVIVDQIRSLQKQVGINLQLICRGLLSDLLITGSEYPGDS